MSVFLTAHLVGLALSSLGRGDQSRLCVKRLVAAPDGPHNAREFVGDRDRGFVVPATGRRRDGPLLQARELVGRFPGSAQRRA